MADYYTTGSDGYVTKAILIFPDKEKEEEKRKIKIASMGTGSTSALGDFDVINDFTTDLQLESLKKAAEVAASETMAVNINSEGNMLKFQFNPATIRIDAMGGGLAPITVYGDKSSGALKREALRETVNVSFKVMFDAERNSDAFLLDSGLTSASGAIKGATSAISNAVTGSKYTVRPIVEGFMASIRREANRAVIFRWSEMEYFGVINDINCRYLMFNPTGEPIRAEVSITIQASSVIDKDYINQWKKNYDAIMSVLSSDSDSSLINTGNISNIANNLINL